MAADGLQPPTWPPGPLARGADRVEVILVALVPALAFLLASFPARNSDLWLHLAAGRGLIQGSYRLGHDPFTSAPAGTPWINHAWLSDLLAYATYRVLGGAALVLGKALLVALTAGVLLRLGRAGRGLWVPAACAGLAVLALGSWLSLQPVCLSYLFLALTLYLLGRAPRRTAAGAAVSPSSYYPLAPLFILWVNTDAWFLLGPLTVGLYAAGQAVQASVGPDGVGAGGRPHRGEPRALALVFVVCLAVCLLNPHHVRAFTLPAVLGFSAPVGVLRQDPAFGNLVVSPFGGAYRRWGLTWSGPSLAYLVLVVLGVLSFVVNRRGWRWWRALLWLALLLLSAYQARAIPFFAVVAGPVLALNVQDYLARRAGAGNVPVPSGTVLRLALAGRLLTALAGAGLLVAAWPGWLQARPYERRAWAVEPDPSLRRVAELLGRWHRAGKLGATACGFNFAPEAAGYFAWFGPQEKGFLDVRLTPFAPERAADYVAVRRALLAGTGEKEASAWRAILRAHHVNHLVLTDSDRGRLQAVMSRLVCQPREWPLLAVAGGTAVFGWRDPAAPEADHFEDLRLDLDRLAFGPDEEDRAPTVPGEPEPPEPRWFDAFVRSRRPRSAEVGAAGLHLVHFDALRRQAIGGHVRAYAHGLGAGLVGLAAGGGPGAPVDLALRLHLAGTGGPGRGGQARDRPSRARVLPYLFLQAHVLSQDDGPTALPYLAVRAARRALRDDPRDGAAYLVLGEAYLRLARDTGERVRASRLDVWRQLRRAQAVTALESALRVNPDLDQAHVSLASLYEEMSRPDARGGLRVGYLDLALGHLKKHLATARQAGPWPGETAEQFSARVDRRAEVADALEREVNRHLDVFEANAARLKVLDRARLACRELLAGKALEVLLATDNAAFGPAGVRLELMLMLTTGRAGEARGWLAPWIEDQLGTDDYHGLQASLAAATGDYRRADAEVRELVDATLVVPELGKVPITPRQALSLGAGQAVLAGNSREGGWVALVLRRREWAETRDRSLGLVGGLVRGADRRVLRGLLALESGNNREAGEAFREALSLWGSEEAVASGAGLDFPARLIAQHGLNLLEAGKKR